MKFYILGSCSGTEPFPGRHHTSIAMELSQGIYFLDAGECCSYTAHNLGLDLLRTRAVFISHCHMDHIGGLGNLWWTVRKLSVVRHKRPLSKVLYTYLPDIGSYEGIMQSLQYTEGDFQCDYQHEGRGIVEGTFYQSDYDDLTMEAVHNHHLLKRQDGQYRSFSFRIRAEGKTIFYSGDTNLEDLAVTVPQQCDLLFMETGHHLVPDVCRFLKESGKEIGRLVFVHHGVEVLADPGLAREQAQRYFGSACDIAEDGMCISLA